MLVLSLSWPKVNRQFVNKDKIEKRSVRHSHLFYFTIFCGSSTSQNSPLRDYAIVMIQCVINKKYKEK